MSYDIPAAAAVLILVGAAVILMVRAVLKRDADSSDRPSRVVPSVGPEGLEVPLCMCGAPATQPLPRLERGRGSVARDFFAMPPRYRRVVPHGAPPVVCSAHAHVGDAELAAFVATEVRAAFLRAYAQVATRAAAFEQEELLARIAGSLTESQRKAGKRGPAMAAIRVLRNGTDGANGEGPT